MGETDLVQEIIDRGDPAEIVRMGLNARVKAGEGVRCQCPDPVLSGERLICGRCLLENGGQVRRREAAMKGPHPFRWSPLDKQKHEKRVAKYGADADRLAMCRFCGGWRQDPRHDGQGEEMWGIA